MLWIKNAPHVRMAQAHDVCIQIASFAVSCCNMVSVRDLLLLDGLCLSSRIAACRLHLCWATPADSGLSVVTVTANLTAPTFVTPVVQTCCVLLRGAHQD